ncbi:alpha/beta hydrolase [Spirillospora sp. NPDC052269]
MPPVLIGHSVGGLIAQHLLGKGLGRAAVAIAPLPVDGVALPASQTRLWPMMSGDPADRYGVVPLLPPHFQHVYANTVGRDEAASLYDRHVVQAPARLLVELGFDFPGADEVDGTACASASVDTSNADRGPLLLVSGQEDRMVADEVTRSVYKLYGDSTAVTDLKQFADRGHSLVIDSGGRAVADHVLGWLADQGLGPRTRD